MSTEKDDLSEQQTPQTTHADIQSSDESDAEALLGTEVVEGEYHQRGGLPGDYETKEVRAWKTKDGPIGRPLTQEPQLPPESPEREQ